MNKIILRTAAIIFHTLLNIIIISYITNYDITGSWIRFILFLVLLFVLLIFLTRHVISYIQFLKSTST